MTNEKETMRKGNPSLFEMGKAITDLNEKTKRMLVWRRSAFAAVVLAFLSLVAIVVIGFEWLEDLHEYERIAMKGEQHALDALGRAEADLHLKEAELSALEYELEKKHNFAKRLNDAAEQKRYAHAKLSRNIRNLLLTFQLPGSEAPSETPWKWWHEDGMEAKWGAVRLSLGSDILKQLYSEYKEGNPRAGANKVTAENQAE